MRVASEGRPIISSGEDVHPVVHRGAMRLRSAKKCRNKATRVAALVPRSSIADAYLLLGRRWESVTWSGFAYAREHEIVFDPFSSSLSAFTVPDLSQVGVQSKLFLLFFCYNPISGFFAFLRKAKSRR